MARQRGEDKKDPVGSGWPQFTTQKVKMVSDFRVFKEMSENRPTATDKGVYAEALFRQWLEQFLPAKYGVTSGYIISQQDSFLPRHALKGKLRHYDVIIYNRMESPVLWTEVSPDHSQSKSNRVIPAEYVHAVLEVKSTFNATAIAAAFKKLDELIPLLQTDAPDKLYKQFLPANFCVGMVFFELPKDVQKNLELLNKLMPANFLRGFFGGIVLSAEGLNQRNTGRFFYISTTGPLLLTKVPGRTLAYTGGYIWSDSRELSPGNHTACMFGWSASDFSLFAFELISRMNGTYRPELIPSIHGLSFMLGSQS